MTSEVVLFWRQVYIDLKIVFFSTSIWRRWASRKWCGMLEGLLPEPTPYTDGVVP